MKHDIARRRTDSVAPDHLSVAKPLRPEDLDRQCNSTWYLPFASCLTWCSMECICKITKKGVKVSLLLY